MNDIYKLLKQNDKQLQNDIEYEIKRRNEINHAIITLIICNEFVTGKRKEKWIKEYNEKIS